MEMKEKKIDSNLIYDGKILKLVNDKVICPNGNEAYREIVKHNGGAAVLVVTEDKKILLIKQYRYAYDEIIYEIPAGKLEKNEDPYVAAKRELEEETGNVADTLEPLGIIYPTCGYSNEKIYLYLALNIKPGKMNLDEDEVIESVYLDLSEVKKLILKNEIKDAKTICAISNYLLKYEK
jgi:ADP-ribose pyrophosphatase